MALLHFSLALFVRSAHDPLLLAVSSEFSLYTMYYTPDVLDLVESFSRIKRKGRFDTLLSYIRSPVAKDKPAPSKMHRIVSHLHLSVLCTILHDRKYTFIYTFSIHSWISSLAHPLLMANPYEPHFIWNSLRFIHHLLRFVEEGRTWRG